ncbi:MULTISPECIES: NUDIX hydrolase [unclassified Sphingopyxis]|jgi:8-oxo-dGTP pyrophosphatase MutT (NUDIX family)|uniref:NUDIX hydrolase n=2 Tax=Sphingopyxis TaxID=165697 RepID=UPI0007365662|nr:MULTISPECIES: NUDIX domain-containing protein [unclassified Sphingopyxis]KTE37755.1 NUDIX hydrolase [Sphingopyxis sp. HIX]KTE84547.1 NUDIX hydrolase [Sphingopyxis sp. HXXIV]
MTNAPQVPEPKPAATLLLVRDQPEFQVLMVKRHHQIDFASGALVFPGGKTHDGDKDERWSEHAIGWNNLDAVQRTLRIGAIREAFEETGILLAQTAQGAPFEGACDASARSAVETGEIAFIDVVRELGVRLDLDALATFARWITPIIMPKRFDTWFYTISAPPRQVAACDGRETVDVEWISPREAIRLAAAGERTIIFPTLMNLQLLAEAESAEDCISRARQRRLVTVLPEVSEENGEPVLVLPPDAGYGPVSMPLKNLGA